MKFKNTTEVMAMANKIMSFLNDSKTFHWTYYEVNDHGENISPELFVSLYYVAKHISTPQTILVSQYPSIEWIRFLNANTQLQVMERGYKFSVPCLKGDDISMKLLSFRDLNRQQCEYLFGAFADFNLDNARFEVAMLKDKITKKGEIAK